MNKQVLSRQLRKDADVVLVVMAGGSGTRFWPASRRSLPKQYLSLGSESHSLIEGTVSRLKDFSARLEVMVVTGRSQVDLVSKLLPDVAILAEPCARNTAACVGFAAQIVKSEIGDIPMVMLPADHDISGSNGLAETLRAGVEYAKANDELLTVGIPPVHPETGYGYIQRGDALQDVGQSEVSIFKAKRFVEKPDLVLAKEYLESGDFFWNSGMFIWRPSVVLDAMDGTVGEIVRSLRLIMEDLQEVQSCSKIAELYESIPSVSIDCGVMEKASNVSMIESKGFNWSDLGSWKAWSDSLDSDEDGNGGTGDSIFVDSKRCSVMSERKLVACVGVQDLVVVDTGDALLICKKDKSQDVRKVVARLQSESREDLL